MQRSHARTHTQTKRTCPSHVKLHSTTVLLGGEPCASPPSHFPPGAPSSSSSQGQSPGAWDIRVVRPPAMRPPVRPRKMHRGETDGSRRQ